MLLVQITTNCVVVTMCVRAWNAIKWDKSRIVYKSSASVNR